MLTKSKFAMIPEKWTQKKKLQLWEAAALKATCKHIVPIVIPFLYKQRQEIALDTILKSASSYQVFPALNDWSD